MDKLEPSLSNRTVFQGHPLLPNLRHLSYFRLANRVDVSNVTTFLTENLVSLDLGDIEVHRLDGCTADYLHDLFPVIQKLAPGITSFGVGGPFSRNTPFSLYSQAFHDLFRFYGRLNHVHMDQAVFASIVVKLPVLEYLESLDLDEFYRLYCVYTADQFSPSKASLPNLRHLSGSFGRYSVDFWKCFLPSVGTVRRLALQAWRNVDGSGHSELFHIIGESCSQLQSLSISGLKTKPASKYWPSPIGHH
jgi:hypothetical protein